MMNSNFSFQKVNEIFLFFLMILSFIRCQSPDSSFLQDNDLMRSRILSDTFGVDSSGMQTINGQPITVDSVIISTFWDNLIRNIILAVLLFIAIVHGPILVVYRYMFQTTTLVRFVKYCSESGDFIDKSLLNELQKNIKCLIPTSAISEAFNVQIINLLQQYFKEKKQEKEQDNEIKIDSIKSFVQHKKNIYQQRFQITSSDNQNEQIQLKDQLEKEYETEEIVSKLISHLIFKYQEKNYLFFKKKNLNHPIYKYDTIQEFFLNELDVKIDEVDVKHFMQEDKVQSHLTIYRDPRIEVTITILACLLGWSAFILVCRIYIVLMMKVTTQMSFYFAILATFVPFIDKQLQAKLTNSETFIWAGVFFKMFKGCLTITVFVMNNTPNDLYICLFFLLTNATGFVYFFICGYQKPDENTHIDQSDSVELQIQSIFHKIRMDYYVKRVGIAFSVLGIQTIVFFFGMMVITVFSPSFPVGILKVQSDQTFVPSSLGYASVLMILYNIIAWPFMLEQINTQEKFNQVPTELSRAKLLVNQMEIIVTFCSTLMQMINDLAKKSEQEEKKQILENYPLNGANLTLIEKSSNEKPSEKKPSEKIALQVKLQYIEDNKNVYTGLDSETLEFILEQVIFNNQQTLIKFKWQEKQYSFLKSSEKQANPNLIIYKQVIDGKNKKAKVYELQLKKQQLKVEEKNNKEDDNNDDDDDKKNIDDKENKPLIKQNK